MRLAVVGKGGAGKSTIAATLARLLARGGRQVLAVDLDHCPGLVRALGMEPTDEGMPLEAIEENPAAPYGWQLAGALDPADAVRRLSLPGPDGVRFLGMGGGRDDLSAVKRSTTPLRQLLDGFAAPDWDVVGDLGAGTTSPSEGYHRFADRILLVVTPDWSSRITAERLLPFLGDLPVTVVASQYRDQPDHPGLVPDWRVPFDRSVRDADRWGGALIDHAPHSPVVGSLERLAASLIRTEVAIS